MSKLKKKSGSICPEHQIFPHAVLTWAISPPTILLAPFKPHLQDFAGLFVDPDQKHRHTDRRTDRQIDR